MTTSLKHPPLTKVTVEEGQKWLNVLVELWNADPRDIAAMASFATSDCETHYGDMPILRSRAEMERMLEKRFSEFTSYRLKKTVRMASENMLAVDLDIRWSGTASNGEMRRSRALEFLTFRDGYACKWELVSCLAPPDLP